MLLRSNYHEFVYDEFYLEILDETKDCYICRHILSDQKRFKDGDKSFEIRKCLIPDLYVLVDSFNEQLTLF